MKLEVTRNVVNDLWPLCRSGDASSDSKALVDRFLAEDRDFATTLQQSAERVRGLPSVRLSPEAERRLLDEARERARSRLLLIGGAVAVAAILLLGSLSGLLLLIARGSLF